MKMPPRHILLRRAGKAQEGILRTADGLADEYVLDIRGDVRRESTRKGGRTYMSAYDALVIMTMFLHIVVDLLIALNSAKK